MADQTRLEAIRARVKGDPRAGLTVAEIDRRHLLALVDDLAGALRALAWKIGTEPPTRLEPDAHDALCEAEYIAPLGDTPCDCRHRRETIRAALARTEEP